MTELLTIDKPVMVGDLDEAEYHADPVAGGSLSVTASKLLLEAGGPAKFDYARRHPRPPSDAMKLGTTVHSLVLGTGQEIEVLDFENRRTGDYKKAEAEAVAAGKLPVLAKDYAEARIMADALLLHPTAGGLLEGTDPEVSMFWIDPEFGITLRGRMDAMTLDWTMPTIVDVKKSKDASPDGFAKSLHEYGYYRQDPWYREGLAACLGCEWHEIDFVFVIVEAEPPYLVATYRVSDGTPGEYGQPTPDDVALGREHNRIAREKYRDCMESGIWPGYSEEIERLELRYYDRQRIERGINDYFK